MILLELKLFQKNLHHFIRVTVGADPHVAEVPVKCVVGGLDGRPDVHTEVDQDLAIPLLGDTKLSSMKKMTIQTSASRSIST